MWKMPAGTEMRSVLDNIRQTVAGYDELSFNPKHNFDQKSSD
jgi:hypothetical protein